MPGENATSSRLPPKSCRVMAMGVLCMAIFLTSACQMPKFGRKAKAGPPWLNVLPDWNQPGTMVLYMPKEMAIAKRTAGDPIYENWSQCLLEYVDTSTLARRVIDQGTFLRPDVTISSKTIPSSDYSVLIIGPKGRAVHVMEPWEISIISLRWTPIF